MLGNLAMGFDVCDVYATPERGAGVDEVVIEGAFKLSDPCTVAPVASRRGFTTLSELANVANVEPIDPEAS